MEDEGKRQNEKGTKRRKRERERYDSKNISRKTNHFHTAVITPILSYN
jgi:hypothetical protein